MRWSIAILLCLFASCRHPAYTLARQGRSQILTPPPAKTEIRNVRRHPAQKTGCDIETASFSVSFSAAGHGNSARVTAKPETYFAPPESPVQQPGTSGITIAETGPRMYSDSLAQLEDFRQAVAAREDAGCLRDDESARLRQAITETFPFPPQIAAYLRFGTYTRTGSIDLIPGFLMRLVSPNGSEPEVAFYTVSAVPGDDRVRISGTGKSLSIPETPGYYRYLYWIGASAHNFRTTVLGAPDRKTLRDATGPFLADPAVYCAKPAPGVFCQSIAASVGMNVGFHVRVNGAEVFARIGGTVGEALSESQNGMRELARRQPLPKNVSVRRMFRGKLIPIKVDGAPNDISALVVMPGDEVTTSLQ